MYKSNLTIYENDSNWIGLWTLYKREILRFFKVYTQTLLAPMVTSILFLSVFTHAFGSATRVVSGLFHTSSSLMVAKAQGSIVDTLMPPFTAQELTFGIALGGMTRGIIGGIWSEKFDHIAAITNFIITPLSFLSGTFYSIERLPEIVQIIAKFNPFFYMIDGFRYGFIDRSDSALWIGILVMAGINMILVGFVAWMFSSGYKLKA